MTPSGRNGKERADIPKRENSGNMKSELSVGIRDGFVLIRALGEMRAGDSFALNEFLAPYLESVQSPVKIFIDLSQCDYLDSTAIGFIISLEKKCRRFCPQNVTILRPGEKCRAVLQRLSVLDLLAIDNETVTPEIPLFALSPNPRAFGLSKNVELMFEAHKHLSDISEENRREFGDLMNELKSVIDSKKTDG